MALNAATLNGNGLRDIGKRSKLLFELDRFSVDVAAIQETHFIPTDRFPALEENFFIFSAFGTIFARGVSLLVRRTLNPRVNVVHADGAGRLVVADVTIGSHTCRVVAVYAPNIEGERNCFFRRLEPYLDCPHRLVAMGDWNAILDPNLDKGGRGARTGRRCERSLINLLERSGLVDRYRIDHPGREMWTWAQNTPPVRTYLDRVLVRRADVAFISCPRFEFIAYHGFDHKMFVAKVHLEDTPRMAGYWKFNLSHLGREDFRHQLDIYLRRKLEGAVVGSRWWVNFKADLKTFSNQYGQRLAQSKALEEASLEALVEEAVAGGDTHRARLARFDLNRLASERYRGHLVRARLNGVTNEATHVDGAQRRMEGRSFPDRFMKSIETLDGRTLKGTREIVEGFRGYFSDLFTPVELPTGEFSSYLADFPRISEKQAADCEGLVTEAEIYEAMRQCKPGKAPGLDGLPYELYLRWSHLFVPILTRLYNHWFTLGHIPSQVTKGVISLMRKKDTTGKLMKDWRPITLLNTELKILAKVLTNRLREVVDSLIGPEQTYAMAGRSIRSNLHLIREVLEGVEDDQNAALVSLDQSKAFDRVDHRYLFKVLDAAGFHPGFCSWIRLFYQSPNTVVQVNGKRSAPFPVSRSVRQGCPLSPLLFVLTLEPFLRRLRDQARRPALRGIALSGGGLARDSAYADDVTLYISSIEGMQAADSAIVEHNRITGSKINSDKSAGLLLGAWRGKEETLPRIFEWKPGPIKILGFWIGPGLQVEKNWTEVYAKVGASVSIWRQRKLSLKGRAEACRTYIFPRILYYLQILPISKHWCKEFNTLLFVFTLWRGKGEQVCRATTIQRVRNGGLGMPSLECHRDAERLALLGRALTVDLDTPWGHKVGALFPNLPTRKEAEQSRLPLESNFYRECRRALK